MSAVGMAKGRASLSVAVIGAGLGGVAMAVKLKKSGIVNFTVFEQSDGPGGTWHDNTYPGCEVDIHSYYYSFSFMKFDWPSTHPNQRTLKKYIEDTITYFDIGDHFRFRSKVTELAWDESLSSYRLRLASGEQRYFNVVVSAVGLLNNPRYPDWPGLDSFAGAKFHTSRWEHEHDLKGKVVAFVGTGSTACQAVPAIAPDVKQLYLFQREPGWVFPKHEREFTAKERRRYIEYAVVRKWGRYRAYRRARRYGKGLWLGTRLNRKLQKIALAYIDATVEDPVTRAAVTPTYPFGCKRTLQASTYYSALNRDNVTLVPHAVERATPVGVVADGKEYEVDVVIMSTGFQAQNFLSTLRVVGVGGRSLHSVWDGAPKAFLGITVPGFPNFFMIYGPNTNGGSSIICNNELEAAMVVRMIKRMRGGVTAVDTRGWAFQRYVSLIDRLNETHLKGQRLCHNYYYSPNGRNVTQMTLGFLPFAAATRFLPMFGMKPVRDTRRSRLWLTSDRLPLMDCCKLEGSDWCKFRVAKWRK